MKRTIYISSVVVASSAEYGKTKSFVTFSREEAIRVTRKVFDDNVAFYNGVMCTHVKIENLQVTDTAIYRIEGKDTDCMGNVTRIYGEVTMQEVEL